MCVNGALTTVEYAHGRSAYLDALLQDPEACIAFNPCAHKHCVFVEKLASINSNALIRYLSRMCENLEDKTFSLRDLLTLCDYLGIELKAFADTVVERIGSCADFTVDDYVVMHLKRLHSHLEARGIFGFDDLTHLKEFNKSPVVAFWPHASAVKLNQLNKHSLDVEQVCSAIMVEPGIGDLHERLALVRRMQPDTVALIDVPSVVEYRDGKAVISQRSAHFAMVELLGQELIDLLPPSSIIAGGSLVCQVGSAPWLPNSDIDVFIPSADEANGLVQRLTDAGYTELRQYPPHVYALLPHHSIWTGVPPRGTNHVQVIASNLAIGAKPLLTGFDEDYVQAAWIPSQAKVVATLDCFRAWFTRESRVVISGRISTRRATKLREKGFAVTEIIRDYMCSKVSYSVTQSLVLAPEATLAPSQEPLSVTRLTLGDFTRGANYNFRDEFQKFGVQPPLWCSTPCALVRTQRLYKLQPCEKFHHILSHRVNGPSLVSPIVQLNNGCVVFRRSWSGEHNNFADIMQWIHSDLGVVVKDNQEEWILITDIIGGAKDEAIWIRCQVAPIFKNIGATTFLRWTILSFQQQARSPFCGL